MLLLEDLCSGFSFDSRGMEWSRDLNSEGMAIAICHADFFCYLSRRNSTKQWKIDGEAIR